MLPISVKAYLVYLSWWGSLFSFWLCLCFFLFVCFAACFLLEVIFFLFFLFVFSLCFCETGEASS